jgi:hypothetical protein
MNKLIFLPIVVLTAISCGETSQEQTSKTKAYNAGAGETHIVIAAPLASRSQQKLWVCQGSRVKPGTRQSGYLVSIGRGQGGYRRTSAQSTVSRGRPGSNLTPVGELRISRKIRSKCGKGMLTRCMKLDGRERGINHRTRTRAIYIHATPSWNYKRLGRSASHGCVRMTSNDVKVVYDQVSIGTRVFINSKTLRSTNPCGLSGASDGGRAR